MNIANLRRLRGLNQEELGEMAGVTQPTISRAEKGDDGTTLGVFRACAAALNVDLADLFIAERSMAEMRLLDAFRRLSPERQRGWLDMAAVATGQTPPEDQETQQTGSHPSTSTRA